MRRGLAGAGGFALALALCMWAETERGDIGEGLRRWGGLGVSVLEGQAVANASGGSAGGVTKGYLSHLPWYESEIINVTEGTDGELLLPFAMFLLGVGETEECRLASTCIYATCERSCPF